MARKLSASDKQYLKAISLKEGKKSNQALAQHLAESSGTGVEVSTGRKCLVGVCVSTKNPFFFLLGKQGRGNRRL